MSTGFGRSRRDRRLYEILQWLWRHRDRWPDGLTARDLAASRRWYVRRFGGIEHLEQPLTMSRAKAERLGYGPAPQVFQMRADGALISSPSPTEMLTITWRRWPARPEKSTLNHWDDVDPIPEISARDLGALYRKGSLSRSKQDGVYRYAFASAREDCL